MQAQPDLMALNPAGAAVAFGDNLVFLGELLGGLAEGLLGLEQPGALLSRAASNTNLRQPAPPGPGYLSSCSCGAFFRSGRSSRTNGRRHPLCDRGESSRPLSCAFYQPSFLQGREPSLANHDPGLITSDFGPVMGQTIPSDAPLKNLSYVIDFLLSFGCGDRI